MPLERFERLEGSLNCERNDMETLIASVVLPAIIDLFKGGVQAASRKWIGLSIDEQIKLQQADVDKLTALAKLDTPSGNPSQWVVDLRASFRYIAAIVVIAVGCWMMTLSKELSDMAFQLISMPFGFIFGERLLLSLKGSK